MPSDNSQNPTVPQTNPDPGTAGPPSNLGSAPSDSHLGVGNAPVQPSEEIPFTSGPPLNDSGPIETQVMANAPMTDDSPPVGIPPAFVPPPKRKMSGGKIVGAILGLLLLVGGIGAGVLLVQQQQDIREKAAPTPGSEVDPSCQPGEEQTENCVREPSQAGTRTRICTEGGNWGAWGECVVADTDGSTCRSLTSGANCVSDSWSCTGNYGQSDCPADQKCGVSCTSGGGGDPGNVVCPVGYCSSADGSCSAPGAYNCINSTQRGYCEDGSWVYRNDASCGGGNTGGGGPTCPNDASRQIAGCYKFTCPQGCSFNANDPDGVEAWRCDSTTPGVQIEHITDPAACNSASLNGACGQIDMLDSNNNFCGYRSDGYTCNQSQCQTGGGNPPGESTPTPSPSNRAQCGSVMAYDTNWNQLSGTQLSALKAGDRVRFTITGTKASGSFTKARFKINQNSAVESAQTKPGSSEVFYTEYTIPAGTTTFQVGAAIYHDSLGWIPNIIN